MSDWVMRVLGVPGTGANFTTDLYLKSYDPDAHSGVGEAKMTEDPSEALSWASMSEVIEAWRAVSTVRPVRDDGKPNRPLTAFTITPMRRPD